MTLNELLSGDAVWEDAFIGLNSEKEFKESVMLFKNCDDYNVWEDLEDEKIRRCRGCIYDCEDYDCFDCEPEYKIEVNNDIKVMLDYDDDLFDWYYREEYIIHKYRTYVYHFGPRITKRIWKIIKIKRRMGIIFNYRHSIFP